MNITYVAAKERDHNREERKRKNTTLVRSGKKRRSRSGNRSIERKELDRGDLNGSELKRGEQKREDEWTEEDERL